MTKSSLVVLLLLASLSLVPAAAADEALDPRLAAALSVGAGLTSEQVARRAAVTSHDVRGHREEVRAAAAAVDQALLGYLPRLTASAGYTRLSDPGTSNVGTLVAAPGAAPGPIPQGTQLVAVPLSFPSVLNHYTMELELGVPLSDYLLRVPQGVDAARGAQRAAEDELDATRLRVAADARLSYYRWVRTRLQVVVAEQALEQAQQHLADVNAAAQAGSATQADIAGVAAQVASSELLLTRTQSLAELLEHQLRTAMHDRSTTPYRIGEDLSEVPAESAPVLARLWNEAANRRLELRALRHAAGSQRDQAAVSRAGYLPRLDAVAAATYANPNQRVFPQRDEFSSSWNAGLQLSWNLTGIPGAAVSSDLAEARAARTDAQRAELEDGIRLQVTEAVQATRESRVAAQTAARGLASATEAYRVRRLLFQNGRATSTELTDAETTLTRARLDVIEARIDQRVAQVRLDHAVGRDTTAIH